MSVNSSLRERRWQCSRHTTLRYVASKMASRIPILLGFIPECGRTKHLDQAYSPSARGVKAETQGRNLKAGTNARSWMSTAYQLALHGLLFKAYSTFLIPLRTICPEVAPSPVSRALPHHSLIRKMAHVSFIPSDSSLCQVDKIPTSPDTICGSRHKSLLLWYSLGCLPSMCFC